MPVPLRGARALGVVAAGLTAALALGAAPASATTEYVQGTVTNRYTYATNPHGVTVAGSNIYLQVTDAGVASSSARREGRVRPRSVPRPR
ncbi:hypothetical protein [Streptomyces sp. NPDC056361]|uniref:hypothetical protein n=1 Tax=Streptomyces sp. NPDC056361 TaxID=3345795 RepID=UPI0035D82BBB